MRPDQYPSNSVGKVEPEVQPPTQKSIDRLPPGSAKLKSRSFIGRFTEDFISNDVTNFKDYVSKKILIPAAKKAVSDTVMTISEMFTSGINMLLYGDAAKTMGGRLPNGRIMTQYGSFWNNGQPITINNQRPTIQQQIPTMTSVVRSGFNYDDICTSTRGEAEGILSQMDEMLDQYGRVSIADMYDLANMACDYTYNNYGWTNIQAASVVRESDQNGTYYRLKMPRAVLIK